MNETTINSDSVSYTETGDEVTVHIRGTIRDNLKKIADTLNNVSWGDKDNTISSVLNNFIIGEWLQRLEYPTMKVGRINAYGIGEATSEIVDSIYTGFERGTPEDTKRREELLKAFDVAGI